MHRASAIRPLPRIKVRALLLRLTHAFLHIITPPAIMLWTWVTLTLFVMFVTWVAAVARFRSSMTKAADDLRNLARDFRHQAQQLTSARQAERDSKREANKRGKEHATLRARVQSLTSSLNSVTAERDSLKSQNQKAETRISLLSEQLATSQANNERLRIELEDATEIRWKLMSRIHTDAAQRAAQFEQFHTPLPSSSQAPPTTSPKRSLGFTPVEGPSNGTVRSEDGTGSSSVDPQNLELSESVTADMTKPKDGGRDGDRDSVVVAVERDLHHSVGFEDLLQLKPDLSVPEYDEPSDKSSQFQDSDVSFGSRLRNSLFDAKSSKARDDGKESLSLDRVPWVSTVNAGLSSSTTGSIAAALQPAIARKPAGLIVSGVRAPDHEVEQAGKS